MSDGKGHSASEILALLSCPNAILSVVGCGGKTTFINTIALSSPGKKVLISPTTKIGVDQIPTPTLLTNEEECLSHIPRSGIQCMGIEQPESHKLTALPVALLKKLVPDYDLILLEADGSRGLPCKGWLPTEPVIPLYTTFTVGIVTLKGVGKPANSSYVLRLPEFLSLTHLKENDLITERALAQMICGMEGMFKNAVGKRFLFINQVESGKEEISAKHFAQLLDKTFPSFFQSIVFGSAYKNLWKDGNE